MPDDARAIVFSAPGQVEFRDVTVPDPGPGELRARTLFSFVSPGTELRILRGTKESKGKFPVIPGYAWIGRIEATGPETPGWEAGELVSGRNPLPIEGITPLWGGQASCHCAAIHGPDAVLKLPAGADPWAYVPAEVAAISWRGVSMAFPALDETAVVIGQGLIGACAARWLCLHGARVIVTDLVSSRLARAEQLGVAAAVDGNASDAAERIRAHLDGGADIVVEASASLAGARLARSLIRQPAGRRLDARYSVSALRSDPAAWPRIVYLATYEQGEETRPGGWKQTEGALVLTPCDRTVGDRRAVMERIRQGALCVDDFLDGPTPVDQAPTAYATLRDHPEENVAVAFAW